MSRLGAIAKSLLNIIYPLRCASCGRDLAATDENGLCGRCLKMIQANPKPYCKYCGRSLKNASDVCSECRKERRAFSRALSACVYDGPIKEAIHSFKYGNRRGLSKLFTKILAGFIHYNAHSFSGIDVITFVPLHRMRRIERGFNQSEVIARAVAQQFDIPSADLLEKRRKTRSQNELSREERLTNVAGAFAVKQGAGDIIRDKNVLIIDDVMTTGATLDECAKALMAGGAKDVRCVTLARGA